MFPLWALFLFILLPVYLLVGYTFLGTIVSYILSPISTSCILLFISWQLTLIIYRWMSNNHRIDPTGKSVLITGCDSGFGLLDAIELHKFGFKVFAGCLSTESAGAKRLAKLSKSGGSDSQKRLIVVELDVTRDEDISKCVSLITKDKSEFWALVNNAGLATFSPIEFDTPNLEDFQRVISVNLIGVAKVTRAFIPLLRRQRNPKSPPRRIVNMSSVLGQLASEAAGAYTASKFGVRALSDSLRRELAPMGIAVSYLEPFFYATAMGDVDFWERTMKQKWDQMLSKAVATVDPTDDAGRESVAEGVRLARIAHGGQEGFDRLLNDFKTVLYTSRSDLSEVTNSILDAVTAPNPLAIYICSDPLFRVPYQIFKLLPIEWADPILKPVTLAYGYLCKLRY